MQEQMAEIISKLEHLIELHNNIEIIRHVASPIVRVETTGGSEVLRALSAPEQKSKR